MKYKIGFANVRYTLWEVNSNSERTTYHFLHPLSSDIERVKTQYPGIEIDVNLKGSHDIIIEHLDKVDDTINCFSFGKYRGHRIASCVDGSYLVWYLDQINYTETDKIRVVTEQLNRLGYVQMGRKWFSPIEQNGDEYKELVKKFDMENVMLNDIQMGNSVQIQISGNPEDGVLAIGSVYYKFQTKLCGNSYYGQYELICNPKTGAGMRLKGKTITITDYECHEVDGYIEVEVKNFIVNK